MAVHLLKLTNGDTILTDVLDVEDHMMRVVNPIEVRMESERRQKALMVAVPWFPMFQEENIMFITVSHVVATTIAGQELQDFYVDAINRMMNAAEQEQTAREELKKLADGLRSMANTTSKIYH